MIVGKVRITGAHAWVEEVRTVTAHMVGAAVALEFGTQWEGLTKTAVFQAGQITRDVLVTESSARIPVEVLETSGEQLRVGVYGTGGSDAVVIPTVWANLGLIREGTGLSGDMAEEAVLPIWEQVLAAIGDLQELKTEDKSSLVAAINSVGQGTGGSTAVTDAHINNLIDAKLGVIENGTY